MSISENLARVRERIARAAARAGRNADEVTLIAISKTFPGEKIREAYEAGVRHFGENRVQEWEGKHAVVADLDATWHLVGHLQSNKVRRAVTLFHTIDSVDSLSLAQKLDRASAECSSGRKLSRAEPRGAGTASVPVAAPRGSGVAPVEEQGVSPGIKPAVKEGTLAPEATSPGLPVLIEVRLSPELTKSGVHPDDLPALAEAILALPHLDLRGLMTIPPLLNTPEDVRPYFRRLRELRESLRAYLLSSPACNSKPATCDLLRLPVLSMGMSHDFEVAIEEGATQIRVGTALFGARDGK